MAQNDKPQPAARCTAGATKFRARVARAIEDDASRRPLSVKLKVRGEPAVAKRPVRLHRQR